MCQSKAEGGLRCSSHAKEALHKHAVKQADHVITFAAQNNLPLPTLDQLYTDADRASVAAAVKKDSEYIAAAEAWQKAQRSRREEELTVFRIAEYGANDALSLHLWSKNKEAQDLKARQQENWDNGVEDEILHHRLAELREMTVSQSKNILRSVREHGVYNPTSVGTQIPQYMLDLRSEERAAQEKLSAVRSEKTVEEKSKAVNRKLRQHPQYIDIIENPTYMATPEHQEWNKKQRKLLTDYSLTNEYRKKLEILAENEKPGSPNQQKIKRQLESVAVLREQTKQRNIAEAAAKSA